MFPISRNNVFRPRAY